MAAGASPITALILLVASSCACADVFSNSLWLQDLGKTNTNTQWQLFNGKAGDVADMTRNTNCWLRVDVSGFWTGANPPSAQMSLITPRHAISAHHLGSEHAGDTIWWRGSDGVLYPGLILDRTNVVDDIDVITFAADFPIAVRPFMVLSTNSISQLMPYFTWVAWYRWNTGRVNVGVATVVGRDIGALSAPYTRTPFYETSATGGDSSGPMWLLYGNRLVLVCALQSQSIIGPFISWPSNWDAISRVVGSAHVSWINLATNRIAAPSGLQLLNSLSSHPFELSHSANLNLKHGYVFDAHAVFAMPARANRCLAFTSHNTSWPSSNTARSGR